MTEVLLDRIRGCLLGGAIGDALGAPVEFSALKQIRGRVGDAGVREFLPATFGGAPRVGLVTDDTQMTLFTVEGIIRMEVRADRKGIGPTTGVIQRAYWRWYDTQVLKEPATEGSEGWLRGESWLYSQRAPGGTCMSALAASRSGDPFASDAAEGRALGEPAGNDSKGCGTVMRSAPFGFLGTDTPEYAWWAACESAAYTHGHPTGQHAAGALAVLIWHLAAGRELMAAVEGTVRFLEAQPGTAETLEALSAAVRAAGTGRPSAEALETLGGGWVAEEALAIAVYASLCYPAEGDVRHGLALSVTHSGDSDSTGSICGNILGAAHGFTALPADLAFQVEGRSTILLLADDLWTQLARGEAIHDSPQWWDRYPGF